jgi:hypothetical protein
MARTVVSGIEIDYELLGPKNGILLEFLRG